MEALFVSQNGPVKPRIRRYRYRVVPDHPQGEMFAGCVGYSVEIQTKVKKEWQKVGGGPNLDHAIGCARCVMASHYKGDIVVLEPSGE